MNQLPDAGEADDDSTNEEHSSTLHRLKKIL